MVKGIILFLIRLAASVSHTYLEKLTWSVDEDCKGTETRNHQEKKKLVPRMGKELCEKWARALALRVCALRLDFGKSQSN